VAAATVVVAGGGRARMVNQSPRASTAPAELLVALTTAAREHALIDLALAPLTRDEARQLTGDLVDAERIYRDSGGNPFYLEELAHAQRTGAEDGLAERNVPMRVRVLIEEELASLSEDARLILRAAAVVGDPFDPVIAAAVGEVTETDALLALDEAAALDLVRPTDAARGLRFRQPIVRWSIYEGCGPGWRIGAHARAAEALAERGAPATWRAGHVLRSAKRGDEDAIELLRTAADDAAPRAPAVAARWFRAALDLLGADAAPERHVALLTPLAASLSAAGLTAESREVLARLLALLPARDRELRAGLLVMVARDDQMLGRQGRARRLVERELTDVRDSAARCVLHLALCLDHWFSLEREQLRSTAMLALDEARAADRPELVAEAVAQVALGECELGATGEALIWLDVAQRLIDGLSDEQLAQRIDYLGVLGHANRSLDRYDAAAALFERALQLVRETGQERLLVPLTVGLATVAVNLGRLDKARALGDAARSAAQLLRNPRLHLWSELVVCRVALASGQLREALVAGADATAHAQDSWNTLLSANAHLVFAAAQLESGEPAEARARILTQAGGDEFALVECSMRPHWYGVLVEAELALGSHAAAEGWAARAEAAAAALELGSASAHAESARARVLLASGDARQASVLAMSAADRLGRVGATVQAARADVLAGRALADAGDRDAAIERLERGQAALAACGANRYRDEAARELRALGSRPSRRAYELGSGVGALTKREREVAGLASSGLTNREIATRLFLSEKTIEGHLSRVFVKLGVASRIAISGVLPPLL
jgi:DNA-binding NarL/FixJ family response regulator